MAENVVDMAQDVVGRAENVMGRVVDRSMPAIGAVLGGQERSMRPQVKWVLIVGAGIGAAVLARRRRANRAGGEVNMPTPAGMTDDLIDQANRR